MANSFKGINTEGVQDVKEAIDVYVDDANKYLELIKSPNIAGAFRGNYAVAVQNFINSVVDEVKRPLEELKEFEEKMEKAAQEYKDKDDAIRSSIGSQQQ